MLPYKTSSGLLHVYVGLFLCASLSPRGDDSFVSVLHVDNNNYDCLTLYMYFYTEDVKCTCTCTLISTRCTCTCNKWI